MPLKPSRLARVLPTRDQACRFLDPTTPNGMVMMVIIIMMMIIIIIVIINDGDLACHFLDPL